MSWSSAAQTQLCSSTAGTMGGGKGRGREGEGRGGGRGRGGEERGGGKDRYTVEMLGAEQSVRLTFAFWLTASPPAATWRTLATAIRIMYWWREGGGGRGRRREERE